MKISDPRVQLYLTPYKYGKPVITGSGIQGSFDEKSVDIPFVFVHHNTFYMMYTGFDGIGYQTALATSHDLINWKPEGTILTRDKNLKGLGTGAAGTWMIKKSNSIWDVPELKKINGKYWMVFHAYPEKGYESGPAEIFMAWSDDEELMDWHCIEKPILSWKDGDEWEKGGLYKACIFEHGGIWYLFYNAKNTESRWIEQTGMVFSEDLINWKRYGQNPVVRISQGKWDGRFLSDPCIMEDSGHFLDFFFGYNNGHAQEGMAFSDDLMHWDKVEEPIIKFGNAGEIDCGHAHKASVIYINGILYHFYCATRPWRKGDKTRLWDEFRCITVAANKPFKSL